MFLLVDDKFVSVRLSLSKNFEASFLSQFSMEFHFFISNDAHQHVLQYNGVIFPNEISGICKE